MADAILDLWGQFRHRTAILGNIEYGVIPEPTLAPWFSGDAAFADAFGDLDSSVGPGQCDDTTKAGGAVLVGHVFQLLQQQRIALLVGCSFAGIASGEHAGCAIQSINLQA